MKLASRPCFHGADSGAWREVALGRLLEEVDRSLDSPATRDMNACTMFQSRDSLLTFVADVLFGLVDENEQLGCRRHTGV
jgi:hypothetical protein